ncbi:MAG: hypothetical protein ACOH2V_00515 [Candidatus Saccharimonadaceae bacterium]
MKKGFAWLVMGFMIIAFSVMSCVQSQPTENTVTVTDSITMADTTGVIVDTTLVGPVQ